jgi:glutamate dehydrogenase (NAD(P)+)
VKVRSREAHQAKLLLEGAHGPTLLEADDVLGERGVLVVPTSSANQVV